MNYDAHDDAIDRPVSPKNEATPYAAVSGAALGGRGGIYCNRKNNNEDLEEEEAFNRDRGNYAYLY